MSAIWKKIRRFVLKRILHADDSPHSIAMGIGIGIFVGLTPTVGLQMVIALALAAAFRANKLVCIPMVWITNPVTLWPIYLACLRVGTLLIGSAGPSDDPENASQIYALEQTTRSFSWSSWLQLESWRELFFTVSRLTAELWVGCLFVASIASLLAYFSSRWFVTAYRQRRGHLLETRSRRREQRRLSRAARASRPSA